VLGATLGLDVEAASAGPRASHGLGAEVAALVRSPVTWRAVAWLAVRAAVSAVAAAALLVGGIVTVALLAIPFSDRWLEWGSFATHSGWAGAWTLLLVPGALLAIAHVLDLSVTVTAAVAPRLLGPDPRDELDALRRRAALLRDRSRLAAELHDGIGHALTVVTLQANAAQRALDDDPEFAGRALAAIEDAGRRAAGEMDGMLSALREEDPEPPGELGLRGLLDLVDGLRAAGLPVELRTTGALGDVPDELGTEIYRMVQEACANVLRHAGRPMTLVAVEVTDRTVDVVVTNERGGDDDATPRRAGSGRGLPGIARRARRLGGSASTGGSAKSSSWSLRVRATPRSPNGWCSGWKPSRRTSRACCSSSTCATAPKPSSPPTRRGSSGPSGDPPRPARASPRG
jgi:signal transduction histidine kinase